MIMENHHSLIKSIVQHRMEYVLRRFVIPIISVDIPKSEVISFVGYHSIYGVIMRPVRRTHTSRWRSPGGDYSAVVTYQGQPGLTIRQGRQILMCVGVVLHRVPLVDLSPHEMGTRGHVLTYIEEGGPRLVVLENVEDLRSLVLYRSVVERQVNRGHLLSCLSSAWTMASNLRTPWLVFGLRPYVLVGSGIRAACGIAVVVLHPSVWL